MWRNRKSAAAIEASFPRLGSGLVRLFIRVCSRRIGLIDVVRETLVGAPKLSKAGGGDDCQAIHFRTDSDIAVLLISHGADIDTRDEDHDSTPAQWRIGNPTKIVKFLLKQAAMADIFMAALPLYPNGTRITVVGRFEILARRRAGRIDIHWETN